MQAYSSHVNDQLFELHNSTSWKVTKPLRVLRGRLAGNFFSFDILAAAIKIRVKQTVRPVILSGLYYILGRPALRKILSPYLKFFPEIRQRLLRMTGYGMLGLNIAPTELDHRNPCVAPDIDAILDRINEAIKKNSCNDPR